jgi:4-amino-4-deoxy-L-arabinose transferase-like glycosyltransferase
MFPKKHTLFLFVIVFSIGIYFLTRLYHILNLPIFTDEAIYVRWAQIAYHDPNWRFISLVDGKQPMFVWFAMVAMRFFKDSLLASRLVSVGTGFMTAWGIFFLTIELFKNRKIATVALFLYCIYPFSLVYDRMALYESTVNMFTIWSLYFSILLIRKITLGLAMVLGLVIGGSALTKSSGFSSAYFLPFTLLLFHFKQNTWKKQFFMWICYALLASILAYMYYSILRLSPFFHIIAEKNAIFVYPLNEWIHHPFMYLSSNLFGMWNWLTIYMSFPWLILVTLAFFITRDFPREKMLLLLWFLAPFIILALIGKTLYPRYLLFMTLSLLPLVAFSLVKLYAIIKNKYLLIAICIIAIIIPVFADFKIVTDFGHAPLPTSDLDQYNNNWPAGGGVKEAVSFFEEKATSSNIYIGTEGTFGLMPYSFEIYLITNPHVTIKGFWPITDFIPYDLVKAAKKIPTYVVFYQPCPSCKSPGDAPISWPLKKIFSYKKGDGSTSLTVYQVHQ